MKKPIAGRIPGFNPSLPVRTKAGSHPHFTFILPSGNKRKRDPAFPAQSGARTSSRRQKRANVIEIREMPTLEPHR
jgi:hypothetical protein